MIKLKLKRFKGSMNSGLILILGELLVIRMNMILMRLRIDMRNDTWKNRIEK